MPETGSEPVVAARCPLWAKLVMVLSISANLIVAGMVVGTWLRAGNSVEGEDWLERRILRSLPEDRRGEAKAVFDERSTEIGELRGMRDELREQAAMLLEADPYDANALLAVFDKRQLASSAMFAIYYERVARLAGELTAEERTALAEGLLRRGRKPNR